MVVYPFGGKLVRNCKLNRYEPRLNLGGSNLEESRERGKHEVDGGNLWVAMAPFSVGMGKFLSTWLEV
jgi:hypothetical protein